MRNIVVLASGTGSLLQALIDAPARGKIYEISCVISDNPAAAALTRATTAGIVAVALPYQKDAAAAWQQKLLAEVTGFRPDLIVSAGFMRIIKSKLFELVPTINAHPSLLPNFPGAHAVADALAANAKLTGATVHYIDQGIDSGKVISQREVPVLAEDSVTSLHERIKQVEREQLVEVVVKLCQQSDLRAGIQS
jgi:phosphoribosylglycinamide formyltransferase 1